MIGQVRIEPRVADDERAPREERWRAREQAIVGSRARVGLPEPAPQRAESAQPGARRVEREQHVVDRYRGHVVGRGTAPASAGVEQREPHAVAEHDVERVEVSVGADEALLAPAQLPSPRRTAVLDRLQAFGGRAGNVDRIAVDDAVDALAVADEVADRASIAQRLGDRGV